MFVLVGLGNPGLQYEKTRHNIGFLLIDKIASESDIFLSQQKFQALIARTLWKGFDILLVKPQSYMNLSGHSVSQILSFFKIQETNLIVVSDDLDQSSGAVKTRIGGGHGGHNGIRSILENVGSDKFYRIKIGIGKPEYKNATASWVLSRFSAEEEKNIEENSFPVARQRILEILKQLSK